MNNGPDIATDIIISNIIPIGLQYISSDTNYGTYNGIWTIKDLLSGDTATVTIIAKIINIVSFSNSITILDNEFDWDQYNDIRIDGLDIINVINKSLFTSDGTSDGPIDDNDGSTGKIILPFTVTFFGQTYNTIYISMNGLVSFDAPVTGQFNELPPSNIAYLAPLWADFDASYIGDIVYSISADQVIITWNNIPCHTNNTNELFNTVNLLINAYGEFAFMYGDLQWANDQIYLICTNKQRRWNYI